VSTPPPALLPLSESTAVTRFDSTSQKVFLQTLKASLQRTVNDCVKSSDTVAAAAATATTTATSPSLALSHDGQALRQALSPPSVDWCALLQHFDQQVARSDRTNTTALQLVVHTMQKTLPVPCHSCLWSIAWEQIIRYGGTTTARRWYHQHYSTGTTSRDSRMTPAQQWLWDCVLQAPHWNDLPYIPAIPASSSSSPRDCQLFFDMLQEIRLRLPADRLQEATLRLLRGLASWEAATLSTTESVSDYSTVVPTRRTRKRRFREVSAYDDSDSASDEDDDHSQSGLSPCRSISQVSLPVPARSSGRTDTHVRAKGPYTLSAEIFEFAVSTLWTCPEQQPSVTRNHYRFQVDRVWSWICSDPQQSSVLRLVLATMLVSADRDKDGGVDADGNPTHPMPLLEDWMKQQWADGTTEKQFPMTFYLRVFSEFVVELEAFDHLDRLERAMSPFLEKLLMLDEIYNDATIKKNWKQAFLYILQHRAPWLDAIPEFELIKARLSDVWPSAADWVNPEMSSVEQDRSVVVLQQAGILGVCDVNGFSVQPKCSATDNAWPFLHHAGLRITGARSGQLLAAGSIFSARDPATLRASHRRGPTSDPEAMRLLMSNSVQGDILLKVFSFLSVRRMALVSLVCRDWKKVADHPQIWRSLFKARYGMDKEDPLRNDIVHQPWKTHFHHRMIVEQEVRSRASRSSRTYRVCKFIGCNAIFSSSLQRKSHVNKHHKGIGTKKTEKESDAKKGRKATRSTSPAKKKCTKKISHKLSKRGTNIGTR
jgi:hypothetical protein